MSGSAPIQSSNPSLWTNNLIEISDVIYIIAMTLICIGGLTGDFSFLNYGFIILLTYASIKFLDLVICSLWANHLQRNAA